MKAVICTRYGSPDLLEIREVPKPIPKDHEVLVSIVATTVTAGDFRVRSATFPKGWGLLGRLAMGFTGPRNPILGGEFSWIVESVGKDVTAFKSGDAVIGFTGAKFGAHAQYICIAEKGEIVLKPENLSHEEAAAISFGGLTALLFLRDKAQIKAGQKILIYWASGGVGSSAIQIAKYYGAEVTAVCSTGNIDLVRSLWADKVIDYIQEDFTKNGEKYDIIMETIGKYTYRDCESSLTDHGRCLLVAGGLTDVLDMIKTMSGDGKKAIAWPAVPKKQDMLFLVELAKTGKFRAVIDRQYPLEEIREAHRYVDSGRKKGSVVISVV